MNPKYPVYIISKGRYFPGALIDRYLSWPTLLFDPKGIVEVNLEKLKRSVLKRMLFEVPRDAREKSEGGLHLVPCRYQKIPDWVKAELKRETERILAVLD